MRVEQWIRPRRGAGLPGRLRDARAKGMGRCEPTTGIAPFGRLVEQVMSGEPNASAARVFWIVGNCSSHRGQAAVDRLEGDSRSRRLVPAAGARLVAGPPDLLLHRATQGRRRNDFIDPDQMRHRLAAFEVRYNAIAVPSRWRRTRRPSTSAQPTVGPTTSPRRS
ncbi:MAG: hypothetical protein QOJ19_4232, partial [Acidimicrobiia bacterium]|nr:hypothetical protein [Acidimicrobiia bacterium]